MSKEAMKLALEALEKHGCAWIRHEQPYNEAITALREALAEQPAQQEPVAWRYDLKRGGSFEGVSTEYSRVKLSIGENWTPLYTFPPARHEPDNNNDLTIAYMAGVQRGKELAQRTWVGLTEEEWPSFGCNSIEEVRIGLAIEAKLKEKNT